MKQNCDLPDILDVTHIQEFMGIGRVKAYELVNSGEFPILRINRRIKIQKRTFLEWLDRKEE